MQFQTILGFAMALQLIQQTEGHLVYDYNTSPWGVSLLEDFIDVLIVKDNYTFERPKLLSLLTQTRCFFFF